MGIPLPRTSHQKPIGSKTSPCIPRLLKLKRNDQYRLEAAISGPLGKSDITEEQTSPGGFVRPFEIKGTDQNEIYELTGCFIGGTHCESTPSEILAPTHKFQIDLHIQKVQRTRNPSASPPLWLTDWYLNGVHSPRFLTRSTTRQRTSEYFREREVYKEPEERFEGGSGRSISSDYTYIQCPSFGFIVHKVPEGLGPAWSKNIGIEYREESGRIPDPPERKAVCEIVGFVMGKHLLNVGYSAFDGSGTALDLCAVQPLGDNAISPSARPRHFPRLNFPPIPTNLRQCCRISSRSILRHGKS